MFASQTRDLSHIELTRSGNISSSSEARIYRVGKAHISTNKIKNKSKNRSLFPFTLALFLVSDTITLDLDFSWLSVKK
jgi:hypothetical protein